MSMQTVSIPALRAAIEGRDAARMLGLYRPDAVLRIIDRDHPPSRKDPHDFRQPTAPQPSPLEPVDQSVRRP